MNLNEIKNQTVKVLEEAGSLLLKDFDKFKISHNDHDHHYGISQDQELDVFITEKLHRILPEASFYTEEQQQSHTSVQWIVDAIEGTTNYSHTIPFFATQCALSFDDNVVMSAIHLPALNHTYSADETGAYRDKLPIHISPCSKLSDAIISIGKGTSDADRKWWNHASTLLINPSKTIRLFGATGIELAYVADGKLSMHLNLGSHPYDFAPGSFLIKQAGGATKTLSGSEWNVGSDSLIAGDERLINQTLALINS